jgi:prepilin-type N-terminal cleavage/methylation domain-containing protein
MKSGRQSPQGFTLIEVLIAVALIGILGLALIPLLSAQNPTKLDLAAAEVGNALRFAINEAERTGGYILVDGSDSGHLRIFHSNASADSVATVTDPLTKRPLDIDASSPALSGQVRMRARFFNDDKAYPQLLIGPGTRLQAFNRGDKKGRLDAGSGIVLTLGSQSLTVGVNETTGLVTFP